jgi:hypothetical protein
MDWPARSPTILSSCDPKHFGVYKRKCAPTSTELKKVVCRAFAKITYAAMSTYHELGEAFVFTVKTTTYTG